jgi:CRP-like cAMP-binding protein
MQRGRESPYFSTPLQRTTEAKWRYAAAEVVFAEGVEGDTAFIIERGQVAVSVERDGQIVRVADVINGLAQALNIKLVA